MRRSRVPRIWPARSAMRSPSSTAATSPRRSPTAGNARSTRTPRCRPITAVLPEADHNEIEGWSGSEGRFAAIFLEDRDQHPRERRRFELTAKAIEPYAAAVINLETEGETRTERVLHTVMLGDLLAIELANARGVDPLAVDVLEGFKKEMGRP